MAPKSSDRPLPSTLWLSSAVGAAFEPFNIGGGGGGGAELPIGGGGGGGGDGTFDPA